MIKERLIWIFGITVLAVSTIVGVYGYTQFKRQHANNFIREIPPFMILGDKVKKLPYHNLYIAGITNDSVFIASRDYKNFVIAGRLKDLDTSVVLISSDKNIKVSEDARLRIDSKKIFLMQGSRANVKIGDYHGLSLNSEMLCPYFTDAVPISSSSFVFCIINKGKQNDIVKIANNKLKFNRSPILQKQVDGIFCTDGILIKAFDSNSLFYIYFYRNQFISIDTNINVSYRAQTIDTNTRAKIKVSQIKSSGDVTLSAPPFFVNKRAAANKTYIFIQSSLKADNETDKLFDTVTPIDVYRVKDGKYIYSFYIPDFGGEKVKDFKVNDRTLVVLYESVIYTFKLHDEASPNNINTNY